MAGQHEQPSAAKPRDLMYDLASAAQHSAKKRKTAETDEDGGQVRPVSRPSCKVPLTTAGVLQSVDSVATEYAGRAS